MRQLIIVLTVVTLALLGYAVWQARQRSALPDVGVLGGAVYDAGSVPANKTVVHTFKVSNPHPFGLGLAVPIAGCTCTTATVSASFIPPHGTAEVTLRVEPEADNIVGSASLVTTHGRKNAETWLFVTGKVSPKRKVSPTKSTPVIVSQSGT